MNEVVARLKSVHLQNERLTWVRPPRDPSSAQHVSIFLDGELYRLAAAFVAKEFPGIFQRVISQSGSYWWNDCWLTEQYRFGARVPTDFYLEVGAEELAENVRHRADVLQVISQVEGVRRFRDVLRLRGHAVQYVEFDGGHDFTAWRQTLPDALRWALPKPTPAHSTR